MHRFYLPADQCGEKALALSEREAHHAADVLRVRPGETVVVLDGAGHQFFCEASEVGRKKVILIVREKKFIAPLPWQITLLQAIPKGKLIESIIEKATELGAARIVPLLSERVTTRLDFEAAKDKAGKWRHVAIEAIKQCGQPWLPQVDTPLTLPEFLARGEKFDLTFAGSLHGDGRHPREYVEAFLSTHQRLPQSLGVWIGPEGDFSPDEMSAMKSAGALPITLGNLVLRCETAAIAALATLNYELQWKRERRIFQTARNRIL